MIQTIWSFLVVLAGLLVTPALSFSYIPQITQLYRTKSAEDINRNFWYILNIGLLCMFILSLDVFINTGSIAMLIGQTFNLGLALIVNAQVIYYQNKKIVEKKK